MNKHYLRHTVLTNLILGLILMLSCTNWVQAQSRLAQTQYANPISNQIVRCYNQTNIISYLVSDNDHYFVLDDNSGTLIHQAIKQNYDVNDFVVYNDYVFFCGQNTSSNSAFVGFFDVNDLFYNNSPFYLTENFTTTVLQNNGAWVYTSDTVQTLTKLIAFTDSTETITVVTIGTTLGDIACVMELKLMSGLQGWSYTAGVPDQTYVTNDETFKQLCLTDNHIVTGGVAFNDPSVISFRIFHRNNLFSSDHLQDIVHYYPHNITSNPYDVTTINYLTDEFAMAGMSDNLFAIFSLWQYQGSSSASDGHMLLIFSIDSTLSSLGCNQRYSLVSYYPSTSTRHIYDMRYSVSKETLHFLFFTDSPVGQYSFLGKVHYPSSVSQFKTFYNTNYDYYSLDNYNNYASLIFGNNTNIASWYNRGLGTSDSCFNKYTIPCYTYHRFSHKRDPQNLITNTDSVYCTKEMPVNNLILNLDIDCQ